MKATIYLVQQFLNVEREEDMLFGYEWEATRFIKGTYPGGAYVIHLEVDITSWYSLLFIILMKIPFTSSNKPVILNIEK